MDLIKGYRRHGSFGPHGMFVSSRLSNESLIGLHSRYNKEVVKLRGSFYLALSKKIKARLGDPLGGCPREAFRGTAAGRVSPEKIPGSEGQRRARGHVGPGTSGKVKLPSCFKAPQMDGGAVVQSGIRSFQPPLPMALRLHVSSRA